MADVAATQAAIDAIAYPPTHTFEVGTLRPLGVLADRVERMLAICPTLFSAAGRMLDVGASKGFFSLTAQRAGASVLAVDPDGRALVAWADLARDRREGDGAVVQFQGTFMDLEPTATGRFDTVLVLNGPHYLYREDQGWVAKLDRLAAHRVLMEGPVGRACKDVRDWGLVMEEAELVAQMQVAGFVLRGRAPSPTYTPDRAIWYFERP